jgi:hypothetical protein
VISLDRHGLWLLVRDEEFFLPFSQFPWFRDANVTSILNVELLHEKHLHWPDLDIDLSVDSLRNPEDYPLVWQAGSPVPKN